MSAVKTAVVAGGTGGIGEGIVRALLQEGWEVFVPFRETERGERLKVFASDVSGNRLHLFAADLTVPAEVAAFKKAVTDQGRPIDLVAVSVGSSYYGYSVHKIPRAEWDRLWTENIATHFNLQHEFLDELHRQNGGVYVTLTGPEADFAHPETGLMSVLAAAQKMLARVEALEAHGTGVKIYSVTSRTPIATRGRGGQSAPDWIHPEELGLYVLALADGRAPECGEPLHVLETREQLRRLLKLPKG